MDDRELLELYISRSENAIRETETKYGRLCFRVACNILGNWSDAEECVNDAFLAAWNRIPPEKPDRFAAFLCGITRNLALKKHRFYHAAKRNRELEISFSELEEILSDDAPLAALESAELGRMISDFLRKEKADARNVFLRKYWFFDTVEEIAARYSFSESKVKSMLSRTRTRLKDYLLRKGVNV